MPEITFNLKKERFRLINLGEINVYREGKTNTVVGRANERKQRGQTLLLCERNLLSACFL